MIRFIKARGLSYWALEPLEAFPHPRAEEGSPEHEESHVEIHTDLVLLCFPSANPSGLIPFFEDMPEEC